MNETSFNRNLVLSCMISRYEQYDLSSSIIQLIMELETLHSSSTLTFGAQPAKHSKAAFKAAVALISGLLADEQSALLCVYRPTGADTAYFAGRRHPCVAGSGSVALDTVAH